MYATGFFITFTFLASYGIPEFGAELFRLKYFYVGVLCSSFPVFVAVPLMLKARDVFPKYFFNNPQRNVHARYLSRHRHRAIDDAPAFLTVLNMVAVIYIVIGLFSAQQYRERQDRIEFLVLSSILLLLLAKKSSRAISDLANSPEDAHQSRKTAQEQRTTDYLEILRRFRLATFLFVLLWDIYVCYGLGFAHVLVNGFLYALLMIAFAWRIVRLDTQLRFETFPGPTAISGQAAIVAALYIVGCLCYTVSVYPHISANYGGGSFTAVPNEVICMTGTRLPQEILGSDGCTVPVKVIHETESMVYVTPALSTGSPAGTDLSVEWQEWRNLPTLYGIAATTIVSRVNSNHPIRERVIDRPPTRVYSSPWW